MATKRNHSAAKVLQKKADDAVVYQVMVALVLLFCALLGLRALRSYYATVGGFTALYDYAAWIGWGGVVLAGAAISFSGLLGFVGLIVPHIMRRFAGDESRLLLPASALGGAALLTLCDLGARTLFTPYELPVGIILSFFGGPFFIWLLLRQRKGRTHD